MITADEFVQIVYEALLLRSAEPAAMEEKTGRLLSGLASPRDVLKEILQSSGFNNNLPRLLASAGASYQFVNSSSQYNEIELLLRHIVSSSVRSKFVVDVGARGRERSNSFDLLKFFGWRGLLIEANPCLIQGIKSDFSGLDIEIEQVAISNYEGVSPLTLGANDDVSSLNFVAAEAWGKTKGSIMVNARRLPGVLEEKQVVADFGLLSIDIEGEDLKVINDLISQSRYRPRYIIIEASQNFLIKSLNDLPVSDEVKASYRLIGQTSSNLILAFGT